MVFFCLRNPLFPILGCLTPVRGKRIRKMCGENCVEILPHLWLFGPEIETYECSDDQLNASHMLYYEMPFIQ